MEASAQAGAAASGDSAPPRASQRGSSDDEDAVASRATGSRPSALARLREQYERRTEKIGHGGIGLVQDRHGPRHVRWRVVGAAAEVLQVPIHLASEAPRLHPPGAWPSLIAAIASHVSLQGRTLVDVGAGTGLFLKGFADAVGDGGRIVALELSPSYTYT